MLEGHPAMHISASDFWQANLNDWDTETVQAGSNVLTCAILRTSGQMEDGGLDGSYPAPARNCLPEFNPESFLELCDCDPTSSTSANLASGL